MANDGKDKKLLTTEEKIDDLTLKLATLVAAMAALPALQGDLAALRNDFQTIQGNQAQLTVAVNHLQTQKLGEFSGTKEPPGGDSTMVFKQGHKLVFPTYDGSEDPLPWLNRCEQYFNIQKMPDGGRVWLAAFYMSGDAQQWYH